MSVAKLNITIISNDIKKCQFIADVVSFLPAFSLEDLDKYVGVDLDPRNIIECVRKDVAKSDILMIDLTSMDADVIISVVTQLNRLIVAIRDTSLTIYFIPVALKSQSRLLEKICFSDKVSQNFYDYVFTPMDMDTSEFSVRLLLHSQYLMGLDAKKNKISALQAERKELDKFLSTDVVEEILSREKNVNASTVRQASILFLDIRNFTGLSEALTPDQVVELLDLLFTDIVDLIFSYKGSVNKFIGDAILATFGCPKSYGNDAHNAVLCAMQLIAAIQVFNQVKPDFIKDDIRVGIGIASGKVFAGNVGSYKKMEYTVIGDTVNLASRLQDLTKQFNSSLVIDEYTYKHLEKALELIEAPSISIRGKSDKVNIFYLPPEQEIL